MRKVLKTVRCLSIKQPHIDRIFSGKKKREYRSWRTHHRGMLCLHASRSTCEGFKDGMLTGVILGVVEVVDCVEVEDEYGVSYEWVLRNPRRFRIPIPYKGAVGLFSVPQKLLPQRYWKK